MGEDRGGFRDQPTARHGQTAWHLSSGSEKHAGGLCWGRGETNVRFMRHAVADAADGMGRRGFMVLAGSAPAWSTLAHAQALPTIGYLGSESPELYASRLEAFREGLADAGYAEGRNIAIEYRWAEGQYSRLSALAKELAALPLNVIVAPGGAEVALAAKSATAKIPIVFEMGADPVKLGLVESLSRPSGNLTGVSS